MHEPVPSLFLQPVNTTTTTDMSTTPINYLAGDPRIDDIICRAVSAAATELDAILPGGDSGGFTTQHCGRLEEALRTVLRSTAICLDPWALSDHRCSPTGAWVIARRGPDVWSAAMSRDLPTVEVLGATRWVDDLYALEHDAVFTSIYAAAAAAVNYANREGVSLDARRNRPFVIRPYSASPSRVLGDVWTLPTARAAL